MAYANGQHDALFEQMLERSRANFLDHKRKGCATRGASSHRAVRRGNASNIGAKSLVRNNVQHDLLGRGSRFAGDRIARLCGR